MSSSILKLIRRPSLSPSQNCTIYQAAPSLFPLFLPPSFAPSPHAFFQQRAMEWQWIVKLSRGSGRWAFFFAGGNNRPAPLSLSVIPSIFLYLSSSPSPSPPISHLFISILFASSFSFTPFLFLLFLSLSPSIFSGPLSSCRLLLILVDWCCALVVPCANYV